MISKLDYLNELKKLKSLVELIIEDNPVLVLKESAEILKTLPVKYRKEKEVKDNKDWLKEKEKEASKERERESSVNLLQKSSSHKLKDVISQTPSVVMIKEKEKTGTATLKDNPYNSPHHNLHKSSAELNNYSINSTDKKRSGLPEITTLESATWNPMQSYYNSNNFTNINNNDKITTLINEQTTNNIDGEKDNNQNIPTEIMNSTGNNFKINKKVQNSSHQTVNNTSSNQHEQSINIIKHIEKEWILEYNYIKENGYNGYNNKRLKESKIISGHAELEGNNKLNIYGNALEVLEQNEFYLTVNAISFEYFNIDLITHKYVIDKLKKFNNLNKIHLSFNNLHSFYQLIKFEEFNNIESIILVNNEICGSNLLKYFLIYRFQNLKYFNEAETSQKDVIQAKKIFEHFDRCISKYENKIKEENNYTSNNNNGIIVPIAHKESTEDIKIENKINSNILNNKMDFYEYVKDNLLEVLEELIED